MKKNFPWKQIIMILTVGVVAYVIWEMWKAFKAGATDIKSLLLSPFTALSGLWSVVTGLFSSSGASTATPQAVSLPSGAIVPTNSQLYSIVAPQEQALQQTMNNMATGGPSPVDATSGGLINPASGAVTWDFSQVSSS